MPNLLKILIWGAVACAGAFAYALLAFHRGEPLSAAWLLTAAACTYAIGYRFYSKWIAASILALEDTRATPVWVHEDGKDYVKTHKWIVFGHHFAAISGPGPLVGPVLAAQFGYLPGTLWLLIGVVLGGAVQDFFILFASLRRDGKSLGEMVRDEIGSAAGLLASVAILLIMIILIAVLGLVVVKALAGSPWGSFTVAATLPIAVAMGLYLRFVRPGKVLEVTAGGVLLLLGAVWGGQWVQAHAGWATAFTFTPVQLAWGIIAYGLAASALPVWLLLAPRDYLSSFMKLGTIALLALGILVVLPPLQLPALTRFIDGTGPVFAGSLFPFCFITIACGAISGFHAMIASGTTPKIIGRESQARPVGYGSMLLESSVAIMALIAAATLDPGVYFAMNSPAAVLGNGSEASLATLASWGFPLAPGTMEGLAAAVGESTLFHRAGGAPTLALGMASLFSGIFGGEAWMGLWYHFALMFEALFILTTVDAGTRVGRFILQAFLGQFSPALGRTRSTPANLLASTLLVAAWGYFLIQGVLDPQGGINSLWPLFGIANQMLALVALCLIVTLLIKMGKARHAWVGLLPLAWLATVTFTAGLQKIFHADPRIGFLSAARGLKGKLADPGLSEAARNTMERQIFNFYLDTAVAGLFLVLVSAILAASALRWLGILTGKSPADLREAPIHRLSPEQLAEAPWPGFLAHLGTLVALLATVVRGQVPAPPANDADAPGIREARGSAAGAAWAAQEDARFKKPRCC